METGAVKPEYTGRDIWWLLACAVGSLRFCHYVLEIPIAYVALLFVSGLAGYFI
jgi:hypothetical protein